MMRLLIKLGAGMLGLLATAQASEIRIPQESGWSGFVSGSFSIRSLSSNTISGTRFENITDREVSSLNSSPSSSSESGIVPNFDIRYTFGESRTQIVLGNLLQDALRYDFSQQLGVRQEFQRVGIFNAAVLFSGFPAKVYKDPYIDGNLRRGDTERNSLGFRLGLQWIADSKFSLMFDYRKIDVDDEESGNFLVSAEGGNRLQPGQEGLLDRDGENYEVELLYDWAIKPRVVLSPSVLYSRQERDGDAIEGDRLDFTATLGYAGEKNSVVGTLFLGGFAAEEKNPVYDKKSDSVETGLGVLYFRHHIFGVKRLSLLVSGSAAMSDNDNRFLDLESYGGTVGVLYRFATQPHGPSALDQIAQ